MVYLGDIAIAQGTLQAGMLFGVGIGLTLIPIFPKGFMHEAVTWITVLLTLGCLAIQTIPSWPLS